MSNESAAAVRDLHREIIGIGLDARLDVPIGPMTTYRVGGAASLYLEVQGPSGLEALAALRPAARLPVLVVGKGSNLLVSDSGFSGLVVVLGDGFTNVEIEGETVVAGGGVSLPVLARQTVKASLTGFEWAVGVPGSVGGAVRMNAGGHGSDMSETLVGVRVADLLSGHTKEMTTSELELAYRSSNVEAHQVVLSATVALRRGDPSTSSAELSDIVAWRRANQPGGANAGSVFTNPKGDSAGRLIDAAGLKGKRIGTAHVSDKHANFIQADPAGSACDVMSVMSMVRKEVRSHFGVDLHPETRLVGFSADELEEVGATADFSTGGRDV